MAPANVSDGKSGPYIYSSSGELVWHGANVTEKEVNNFYPCQIGTQQKLCMLDLRRGKGLRATGPALIIGPELGISKETGLVAIQGGQAYDMHELNVVDNGTAIVTIYDIPRIWDLSSQGGPKIGYVRGCGFQEISVENGTVNFQWDALDHIDLADSHMPLGQTEWGDGLSPETSWDYFHINSVDKNGDGDYLISSRHTSTIAKISGANGTVIWRLGGRSSDFTFEPGLNFSSQHHARWLAEDDTSAVLSVFNNGHDGFRQTANSSSGLIIHLDTRAMHATLVHRYPAPEGFLSHKKGSLQQLPSGNAFCNWGGTLNVSEHTQDGSRTVFQAHMLDSDGGADVYRVWKGKFTSAPATRPDVSATAISKTGPTVRYVSWNGATEVKGWRIYTSRQQSDGYGLVGYFRKEGFETNLKTKKFAPWAVVEAVNGANEGIANATVRVHIAQPGIDRDSINDRSRWRLADERLAALIIFGIVCSFVSFLFRRKRTRQIKEQNPEHVYYTEL